jgi:hypothetical protein
MTMTTPVLPAQFAHLAPYTKWSLATETERNTLRNTSDMADITAFKDAMLADVDAIVTYLDSFKLDAMPADALALMYMLLSLAEVGPAVEFYKQPAVIDGYDPRRFIADEKFVLRPAV